VTAHNKKKLKGFDVMVNVAMQVVAMVYALVVAYVNAHRAVVHVCDSTTDFGLYEFHTQFEEAARFCDKNGVFARFNDGTATEDERKLVRLLYKCKSKAEKIQSRALSEIDESIHRANSLNDDVAWTYKQANDALDALIRFEEDGGMSIVRDAVNLETWQLIKDVAYSFSNSVLFNQFSLARARFEDLKDLIFEINGEAVETFAIAAVNGDPVMLELFEKMDAFRSVTRDEYKRISRNIERRSTTSNKKAVQDARTAIVHRLPTALALYTSNTPDTEIPDATRWKFTSDADGKRPPLTPKVKRERKKITLSVWRHHTILPQYRETLLKPWLDKSEKIELPFSHQPRSVAVSEPPPKLPPTPPPPPPPLGTKESRQRYSLKFTYRP
jgi:hypothetical protein